MKPFLSLYPEIWLACMSCLVLLADALLGKYRRSWCYYLSLLTLLGSLLLTLKQFGMKTDVVWDSFIRDDVGSFLKILIDSFGMFVLIYSHEYLKRHKMHDGEYYVLCLFSILGMKVLVSASTLLTLYLGVELLALPLYALIAMSKDRRAPEAAMKYFVMGALASGMMLYGISLLYGVTGTFEMSALAQHLTMAANTPALEFKLTLLFGMVFVLAGLAFKLGVVPFHMWVPDVYEGSASSVTLFIGTLPELAGFGMAIRLLLNTFPSLAVHWQPLWIIMAILSLAIGNIVAIAQTNLKRMLAYSAIGHIGFVFLGLLAGPEVGYGAALAYIVIYSLMALGAFGIIIVLSHQDFEAENIADFKGLGKSQPWVAFLLLLILFSLAGVPPTVGFYAKFLVLEALIQADYTWLAIVAVIFAVIGAYYYLRIVRVMFFDPLPKQDPSLPTLHTIQGYPLALVSINGLAILVLGIYPAPLISACFSVFK